MDDKILAVILTDTHLFEKKTKQNAIIDCNFDIVFKAFEKAIKLAIEHKLKYVFHAGDFFDSRKHQSQALMEFAHQILDLFKVAGIQLILVSGNHDKTSYEHEYSFLKPFEDHPNLTLISSYGFLDTEFVKFHFVAFFDNNIYFNVLQEAINNIDDKKKNVLITHIGIHGALNNDKEKTESSLTFKMFEDFSKTLIGHYHNYASFIKDKIVYIGSAIQHNFGEDNKKGIILLDSNLRLQRVKTDFKEYKTIEIEVSDIKQSDIDDLINNQEEEYQRIIITGEESLVRSFDRTKLTDHGIMVNIKATQIEIEEIEQKLDSHDKQSIFTNFTDFCTKNTYNEVEGLPYLKKAI